MLMLFFNFATGIFVFMVNDLYTPYAALIIMCQLQNVYDQLKHISKFETTYFDMSGNPAYRKTRLAVYCFFFFCKPRLVLL